MKFEHKSKTFNVNGASEEDHIYKRIVQSKNFYELDLLEYIYQLKSFINSSGKKNVSIDVGANIGNHSIFFGSFISDKTISIEPNPTALSVLKKNLNENISDFSIYENAVGREEGQGSIELPEGHESNVGAAKIIPEKHSGSIKIETLDSILSSWKKNNIDCVVNLIKIDVEGMELDVLNGAKNTIKQYKPHMFLEAMTPSEYRAIYKFLKPLGYKRLPGRKAATPVYHFAYKPSMSLLTKTNYMHLKTLYWNIRRFLRK